jgi:ankyrin repeat protein
MTPLHYAAWQGSIDCVQLLLEHKADINKGDAVRSRSTDAALSHVVLVGCARLMENTL